MVKGKEKIGFTRLDDSYTCDYDSQNDVILYDEVKDENYLILQPGDLAIFFPNDIHKPQIAEDSPEKIKKVVVKVKTSLFSK